VGRFFFAMTKYTNIPCLIGQASRNKFLD
jgi:hypothetical protein